MTKATIAGLAILGLPLFILALGIFWRRQRAIIAFVLALITVGLGYLAITGAAADIARSIPLVKTWVAEQPASKPSAAARQGQPKTPDAAKPDAAKQDAAKPQDVSPKPDKPVAAGPKPQDNKPVRTPSESEVNKPDAADQPPPEGSGTQKEN